MKQIVEGEEWINKNHGRVGKVIKVFVKNGELHVTYEVIFPNDGEKDHRTLDENTFRWLYKPPSTEE